MQQLVHHEAQCPTGDSLNCSLADSILEVSSNSTEGDLLFLESFVFQDLILAKRMVVRMKVLELDSALVRWLFEGVLALNGVSRSK